VQSRTFVLVLPGTEILTRAAFPFQEHLRGKDQALPHGALAPKAVTFDVERDSFASLR
jgi:hypothetical protein